MVTYFSKNIKSISFVPIVMISLVAFLYWTAQYIFIPVLPLFVQSKTTDLQLTGLALSIYGLGHIVIRIPVGIIVGKLGRNKPLIIIGLILLAMGTLVMGFSSDIGQLILGRGISGLAAGTWVPLVLLFNRSFPVKDQIRSTALVTFVSAAARFSASGLSTLLMNYGGFIILFLVSAGVAILAAALLIPLRESTLVSEKVSFSSFTKLISKKDVLVPSLLGMLAQHVNWGLTFGFLPIVARSFGAGNREVGSLIMVFFSLFLVGSLFTAILGKSLGNNRMVQLGFLALIAGTCLAFLGKDLSLIYFAQGFIGFAIGICEPLLMGMSIHTLPDSDQSTALGFHQTIYAVGMFSGPFLSGLLASRFGFQNMFLVTAITTSILFILWFRRIIR
jgi:MFS transporter, DHA1 family, multidrug resistance protein